MPLKRSQAGSFAPLPSSLSTFALAAISRASGLWFCAYHATGSNSASLDTSCSAVGSGLASPSLTRSSCDCCGCGGPFFGGGGATGGLACSTRLSSALASTASAPVSRRRDSARAAACSSRGNPCGPVRCAFSSSSLMPRSLASRFGGWPGAAMATPAAALTGAAGCSSPPGGKGSGPTSGLGVRSPGVGGAGSVPRGTSADAAGLAGCVVGWGAVLAGAADRCVRTWASALAIICSAAASAGSWGAAGVAGVAAGWAAGVSSVCVSSVSGSHVSGWPSTARSSADSVAMAQGVSATLHPFFCMSSLFRLP